MTEPSDYSPDSGSAASVPEQAARPAAGERAAFARVPLAAVLAWGIAGMVLVAVSFFVLVAAGRIGEPVTVTVDGLSETVRSTRPDVAGVLADLGLALRPEDRVSPPLATRLAPGLVVTVVRARAGLVSADGRLLQLHTQAGAVGELVAAAGVQLGPHDEIWLDGAQVTPETALPRIEQNARAPMPRYARSRLWVGTEPPPVRLRIRRAVPLTVDDGSVPYTFFTTAPTIGEALLAAGLTLYLGDRVQPSLGAPVSAGVRVVIERSTPVFVTADGRTTHTRTRGKTVGGTLMDLGIVVAGSDRVTPPLNQPVVDQQLIRVARVSHVTLVERRPIPYEAVMVPDDELEIDQQRLAQAGQDGEHRRRYKVVYEDGTEVSRSLVDEWVAAQPVPRMVAYGRKIVLRQLDTPEGPVTYWRKIRMYATAYSPARSGTPITAPWYGRTRIGLQLRKGIVAVDPKLIPLQSRVYVPDYGVAIAGDTGGGVKGKWIDMGYSDADYQSWHWWVDVYVLDPPPARSKIAWVLPNYPPAGFPYRR